MKRWVLRVSIAGLVLAVAGFSVAASGIIPVKASSEHWPVTRWFLRFSMQRSIATHSLGIEVPRLDDSTLVLKGAGYYEIGCRSCHGAPGMTRPRIANSMMPQPPLLPERIVASNPRKLFYVVKHGMKFTGMPAWPSQERDDEVWAMVAFLLKLPDLDEAGYQRLVEGEPAHLSHAIPPVVQTCARCHGGDGLGRGEGAFPKLAAQRSEYLDNALTAYASGSRHSGIMQPVAGGLTRESIQLAVRYYAGLTTASSVTAKAEKSNAAAIERGRAIASDGIRPQRVPACVECHEPGGRRAKPSYPSLAGQHSAYLQLQLQLFKSEQRGGSDYAHLMRPVASRLTNEQMRDVALYFESLPATPAAKAERGGR